MSNISLLQGSSGRIFIDALSPKFIILSLPLIIFYTLIINSTLIFDLEKPTFFIVTTLTIGFSLAFGLTSTNAKYGIYEAYWLTPQTNFSSALRVSAIFISLVVLVLVPFTMILSFLYSGLGATLEAMLNAVISYPLKDKLLIISSVIFSLVILSIFVSSFAIVAVCCENYKSFFELELWRDKIIKQWGSIMLINALVVSHSFLIALLYMLPLLFGLYIVDMIIELSSAYIILTLSCPILLSSILLGKLAGAFYYEDSSVNTDTFAITGSKRNLHRKKTGGFSSEDISIADAHQLLVKKELAENKKNKKKSLNTLLDEFANDPENLSSVREIIAYFMREGNASEMITYTNTAISLALRQGKTDVAAALFLRSGKLSGNLRLEPSELQEISKYLADNGKFIEAWKCASRAFSLEDSKEETVQRSLLGLAKQASAQHAIKESVMLYQHFLKKYPDSELTTYAKNSLEMLNIN